HAGRRGRVAGEVRQERGVILDPLLPLLAPSPACGRGLGVRGAYSKKKSCPHPPFGHLLPPSGRRVDYSPAASRSSAALSVFSQENSVACCSLPWMSVQR